MSVSTAVRVERFPREQGQQPWAAVALMVGAAVALVLAGSLEPSECQPPDLRKVPLEPSIGPGDHRIETPVGDVTATLHPDGRVSVRNVPSHRHARGVSVDVAGYGRVTGDVAWGGNWFFLVGDHTEPLEARHVERLTDVTRRIRRALDTLPESRSPTKRDWERLSSGWRRELDERIATLEAIRGRLTTCIGCGCLSLKTCSLLNPGDDAARLGAGAHYLHRMPPTS